MFNQRFIIIVLLLVSSVAYSQCDLLSGSREVSYKNSGACAPVDVTEFEITYTFLIPQDPDEIMVRFFWNDSKKNTEDATLANGKLSVEPGNMVFTATAGRFRYERGKECFFEPQSFLYINGVQCESSEQIQLVTAWDTDAKFGGKMAIDPNTYDICKDTPINAIVFTDASTFNCNENKNPDNPNIVMRHTQFVYGTKYTPGAIRDISLDDGGFTIDITDNLGNLVAPETRGTAGLKIEGAHFGEIVPVPFPANDPNNFTLPLSAPANPLNLVGSQFEISLFNWNVCNPFNGDKNNPNYDEAEVETVLITIVEAPDPDFQAREGGPGGIVPDPLVFCVNEDIYFENLTPGGPYNYVWEFYDGSTDGTGLATTPGLNNPLNSVNPVYQFENGGEKLVRLIVSDPNADGVCEAVHEETITLSPDAVATFDFTDTSFTTIIEPDFCQTGSDTFQVGFIDNTVLVPNTELRYEFFNKGNPPTSGNPDFTEPADGSFLTTNIPDFIKNFSTEEYVVVRLIAKNSFTDCSNIAQDTIFIYSKPQPSFIATAACEGFQTYFSEIADPINSLPTQVNGDEVSTYEWDFSYNGTFNPEITLSDNDDFEWYLDGIDIISELEPLTSVSGTYQVALRMTTGKGQCSEIFQQAVTVEIEPDASFTLSPETVCPDELVTFINTSSNPTIPTSYQLEVSHASSGFSLSENLMDNITDLSFGNPDDTARTYTAQINATSDKNCVSLSDTLSFKVIPDEKVEFTDPDYNFFRTNCSPYISTMVVEQETIELEADQYQWTLLSNDELVDGYPILTQSTDPNFNQLDYSIVNTSETIVNYQMILEAEKMGICITNDTFNIQISPQPLATFSIDKEEECERVIFKLEAIQKSLANYEWNFSPTPTQIIETNDVVELSYSRQPFEDSDFNVTLSLSTTNLASCESDPEIVIETIEKQRPEIVADFTLNPTELQQPDNVVTITNLSIASEDAIYLWDFGDGSSSSQKNPGTHIYEDFGTFQITLEISEKFCTVSASQTITVFPAAPILDFEADVLEGCAPITVQFTNLSQFAEAGKFLWEFGDGSISRGDNPTYTFFQSGNFTVRLRGENEVGEATEVQKEEYIKVFERPFADFFVSNRVVYIPDQQAIFNNLSENAVSYIWDFGDGSTSTEVAPMHAYAQEGVYDIMLIATNEFGCADTLFREAEIEAISGGEVKTPNAFTPSLDGPNSDGTPANSGDPSRFNDVFLPRLEGVEKFRMFIYNKWGEMVFESNSQEKGWDGYYKNRLAPAGVYVYKLELRFSDGKDVIKVGDVTLIR
ncbi:MAG: PKD domain-containing protein [Bacteroidota bacterium]